MSSVKYEAAAAIAAYAPEVYMSKLYATAAAVANGRLVDPQEAIDLVCTQTENHPRLPFEAWLSQPDSADKIGARVALQENFLAYTGLARRTISPLLRATSVVPLHRMHMGSGSIAFNIRSADGDDAILKVSRKVLEYPRRIPLTAADRAEFAENCIRRLPAVPAANFEEILAASYSGAVVTSRIPGGQIERLGKPELTGVTDDHLRKAVVDIRVLSEAGVLLDGNGTNTVHDLNRGFGFFDPLGSESSTQYCLKVNMGDFARSIMLQGPYSAYAPRRARSEQSLSLRCNIYERLGEVAVGIDPKIRMIIEESRRKP